tara:strand:- start:315 stop:1025 length:711 start_codon:yes stop_codon:yes gene_type:complete
MFKRKFILKLGLETLAIVVGISVSFWLNEISIKKNNENERIRVLNNLFVEVEELDKYCAERMKIWNQDISIYSQLLDDNLNTNSIEKIAVSKSRVEYNLIYYRDFSPPMNKYKSLVNTGDLKYVKSEKIIEILTRLHNSNLNIIQSTVEYEKSLKSKLISLLTLRFPNIIQSSDDTRVSLKDYLIKLHSIIENDENLKSELLVQMKYFRTRVSSLNFYLITLEELRFELLSELQLS